MEKAFHGRSLATLSATASRKVQAGFEPLVQGFVRVPLNDLDGVRQVAAHNKNVVAVFVEPIQGEGGINVSRMEYLKGLKRNLRPERVAVHVRRNPVRPGTQRQVVRLSSTPGILPDVVPLAKGWPAACRWAPAWSAAAAKGVFKPGNHGSTFGGNQLAMRGVVTTLDTMKDEGLLENARRSAGAMIGGLEGGAGRRCRGFRGTRHGADDRRGARPPLRRAGEDGPGRRAGIQCHGRQRHPPPPRAGDQRGRRA
jgi:acetylornithine aminotransferase